MFSLSDLVIRPTAEPDGFVSEVAWIESSLSLAIDRTDGVDALETDILKIR